MTRPMKTPAAITGIVESLRPHLARTEADPRPVVLMTCGIAGAGKSTLSQAVVASHPNFDRLSIDAILAEKHGLFDVDYAPDMYMTYLEEAADECQERLTRLLAERDRDVVFDRAFWNKEDRDQAKKHIEKLGARWVLAYLKAPDKVTHWRRICARGQEQITSDCAYQITPEILDMYWEGFEEPIGEGEIVFLTGDANNEVSG
ncbi:ATP/GTP-binding protein [Astrocystis sublimbata]|nr:ATP/GTP-binding protein [Astrocystis sublimbata]